MNKSADARVYSAGMTYILAFQVHSEDRTIREKSHDSRFFCILRFPRLFLKVSLEI
ncbi:MAG: hypothetical protein J6P55_07835 [Bacteroidaceae bacterium]|nr:hypothetical protein [Bacteroidaceae bacterium]